MEYYSTISLVLILSCLMAASVGSANRTSGREFLEPHNAARAAVGVGPLRWNRTLEIHATNHARSLVLRNCRYAYSGGPYGENLAAGARSFSPRDAARLWVNERLNYDYRRNTCVGRDCRHYTQVVWRNTRYLGCARVRCSNRWWIIVCNYSPAGNYIGQRPY